MINSNPDYIFKGSLAGTFINCLPLAIIGGCFPSLTIPTTLIILTIFIFRCHCAYFVERVSTYATLILALHVMLAPLVAAGFIALASHETLPSALAISLTLAPILISVGLIVISSQIPSSRTPFHVRGQKTHIESVDSTLSKKRAFIGGLAALIGSYLAGKYYAYHALALAMFAVGIYIIVYFHPAIRGLYLLKRTESRNHAHYEFENLKEIREWRARSWSARAAGAIRNILIGSK
jgi:hypothetical protein